MPSSHLPLPGLAVLCLALGCLAPAPAPDPGAVRGTLRAPVLAPHPAVARAAGQDTAAADATLVARVREFTTDERDLESWLSVAPSATRRRRLDALSAEWRERLGEQPHDALGVEGRIDRLLLLAHLAHGERQRAVEQQRADALWEQLPFADAIIALEEGRWTLEPFAPEAVAGQLASLADLARPLADEPPEVSPVDALWLARRVDELAGILDTWRRHHQAYDPGFAWWTDVPADRLAGALGDYAKALREERAGQAGEDDDPLVGDPIGRAALLDDLAHEWIAYTPEELSALGRSQLAWCEERMLEASNELGYGDDWKAALEHVKGQHVAPGEQDDLVLALGHEAVAWLDERGLVSIPALCRETWRVRMLTTDGQRTLPFAAYGGQHMLVASPTVEMEHDAKLQAMRGNNTPFTRIVTPHELIPGHHLQGYMARRFATHRQLFGTPFLGEGWALHWEMLLWDGGWGRTPEERMGMLFWRMHRAARIVFSLGFHLGEMTPQEAIDFLVERVGHERDNATAEVRRSIGGDYSPLYQCAYMVGAFQLQALYAELVGSGAMDARSFHDAVLQSGPIPVELIRARLTGTLLPADATPSWRFAGDPLAEGR